MSDQELLLLDTLEGNSTIPSAFVGSVPVIPHDSSLIESTSVSSIELPLPQSSNPPSLDLSPPTSSEPVSIFSPIDFPPLVRASSPVISTPPRNLVSSPSFADPSLQKSLDIFSAKTPLSPSVLSLDSIRFENVTIRKKKKASLPVSDLAPRAQSYTPLSTRLKNVTRNSSASSPRVLRALSPIPSGS